MEKIAKLIQFMFSTKYGIVGNLTMQYFFLYTMIPVYLRLENNYEAYNCVNNALKYNELSSVYDNFKLLGQRRVLRCWWGPESTLYNYLGFLEIVHSSNEFHVWLDDLTPLSKFEYPQRCIA